MLVYVLSSPMSMGFHQKSLSSVHLCFAQVTSISAASRAAVADAPPHGSSPPRPRLPILPPKSSDPAEGSAARFATRAVQIIRPCGSQWH